VDRKVRRRRSPTQGYDAPWELTRKPKLEGSEMPQRGVTVKIQVPIKSKL
jgi:hypothetical protein